MAHAAFGRAEALRQATQMKSRHTAQAAHDTPPGNRIAGCYAGGAAGRLTAGRRSFLVLTSQGWSTILSTAAFTSKFTSCTQCSGGGQWASVQLVRPMAEPEGRREARAGRGAPAPQQPLLGRPGPQLQLAAGPTCWLQLPPVGWRSPVAPAAFGQPWHLHPPPCAAPSAPRAAAPRPGGSIQAPYSCPSRAAGRCSRRGARSAAGD